MKILKALADHIAWHHNDEQTNTKILEEVQAMFPDNNLHNSIWNKQLHGKARESIIDRINGNMAKAPNLRRCKTLSEMRKIIKKSRQVAKGSRTFQTEITFTNEQVFIGKKGYALELDKNGVYQYYVARIPVKKKRVKLRLDALAEALKQAK